MFYAIKKVQNIPTVAVVFLIVDFFCVYVSFFGGPKSCHSNMQQTLKMGVVPHKVVEGMGHCCQLKREYESPFNISISEWHSKK